MVTLWGLQQWILSYLPIYSSRSPQTYEVRKNYIITWVTLVNWSFFLQYIVMILFQRRTINMSVIGFHLSWLQLNRTRVCSFRCLCVSLIRCQEVQDWSKFDTCSPGRFYRRSFRGDSRLRPRQVRVLVRVLERALPSQFQLIEIDSDPLQRIPDFQCFCKSRHDQSGCSPRLQEVYLTMVNIIRSHSGFFSLCLPEFSC